MAVTVWDVNTHTHTHTDLEVGRLLVFCFAKRKDCFGTMGVCQLSA